MMEWKKPSHLWWFDNHSNPRRSPWLQSTLSELDERTKAMLKLIEEDADSFAQRAEMYYKKRPELINMVEDFYRAHRSLAERFDKLKLDPGSRLTTSLGTRYWEEKITIPTDKGYDSYSENFGSEGSAESEVDDPEHEEETQGDGDLEVEEEEVTSGVIESEVMKLTGEIDKLKEENKIQRDQLTQKDEEKREVIRQLSMALEILREENVNLRRCISKESSKKWSIFEFNKLKEVISGRFRSGDSKS